jgi:hypothetical protein
LNKHKRQHYLPQSYLKGFCESQTTPGGKSLVLHFYDKETGEFGSKSPKNFGHRSYLYSFVKEDGTLDHSLEEHFGRLETGMTRVMKTVQSHVSLLRSQPKTSISLPQNDRTIMLEFFFWMMKRTPSLMDQIESEITDIHESLYGANGMENDTIKNDSLRMMVNLGLGANDEIPPFMKVLEEKNFRIMYLVHPEAHFVTSDNPVQTANLCGEGDGIGVESTEVYFPLSSCLLLFLHGEGDIMKYIRLGDRPFLRKLNIYMAKKAHRYVICKNEIYLRSIVKKVYCNDHNI